MDSAAVGEHWGNTAQEANIQKLIKKSARKDKATHTKKAMAEAADDRTGKLLYNTIKSTKKGFTSEKLCLSKDGNPQPLDSKAKIFAEHLQDNPWAASQQQQTDHEPQSKEEQETSTTHNPPHTPSVLPSPFLADVSPFSLQEILQALSSLKKGKAPGPERMPMDLIKLLDAKNLHIILLAINEAYVKGELPVS